MKKIRVVFMGSPDFALPALRALYEHFQVVGVVTQPDRPSGRGKKRVAPPVKRLAERLDLPLMQPRRLSAPDAMAQLREWQPDVIVVAAFGQILKADALALPPYGCLNIHASLLPRWRGASPIQAALLHGDAETGVTIMQMDAGLDTGPILSQRSMAISAQDTAGTLFDKLAPLGADLLLDTLPRWVAGEMTPRQQDERRATYAPMLKKQDGLLDFARPVEALERQVRAFNPWPVAWMWLDERPLRIWRARIGAASGQRSGTRLALDGYPAVAAANGTLILESVQPAGKKVMSGKAFLAGARRWLDSQ